MAFGIEEVDFLFETFDEENAKTFENYKTELQGIRAGRANPHILDKVEVEYYGTMTPLNQMANVTIAEARVLVVSVWDKSALKNVEKAILAANVGITRFASSFSTSSIFLPENSALYTHYLVFFFLCGFVNLFDFLREAFIDFFQEVRQVVFGDRAVFFEFFKFFVDVATMIS